VRSIRLAAAGAAAILALGFTVFLCIAVLLPRRGEWTFTVNARTLIREHLDVPQRNDSEKLMRFLTDHFQGYYETNLTGLDLAYGRFWWACVSLSTALSLWILDFAIG